MSHAGVTAHRLGLVSLLVRDYDEAISWFTAKLGFQLTDDANLGNGKRWVVVKPGAASGAGLLLAKAVGKEQQQRIGSQAGGRVFLFLETDSFHRDHQAMLARGVQFLEEPREEPYATVAVFVDLYGNRWDLLQPRR